LWGEGDVNGGELRGTILVLIGVTGTGDCVFPGFVEKEIIRLKTHMDD